MLDTNRDGTVSTAEFNAYRFTSTAGNPNGQVNNYRIIEVQAAPYTVKATGKSFYLQDTWTYKQADGQRWRACRRVDPLRLER